MARGGPPGCGGPGRATAALRGLKAAAVVAAGVSRGPWDCRCSSSKCLPRLLCSSLLLSNSVEALENSGHRLPLLACQDLADLPLALCPGLRKGADPRPVRHVGIQFGFDALDLPLPAERLLLEPLLFACCAERHMPRRRRPWRRSPSMSCWHAATTCGPPHRARCELWREGALLSLAPLELFLQLLAPLPRPLFCLRMVNLDIAVLPLLPHTSLCRRLLLRRRRESQRNSRHRRHLQRRWRRASGRGSSLELGAGLGAPPCRGTVCTLRPGWSLPTASESHISALRPALGLSPRCIGSCVGTRTRR
mmetsp:Transcript_93486/g.207990  ORF Transcript_93486/g.207990 Transcript_93486/m.207990 type:complete len:307 (+) Transcript_93486:1845-2765(+)